MEIRPRAITLAKVVAWDFEVSDEDPMVIMDLLLVTPKSVAEALALYRLTCCLSPASCRACSAWGGHPAAATCVVAVIESLTAGKEKPRPAQCWAWMDFGLGREP